MVFYVKCALGVCFDMPAYANACVSNAATCGTNAQFTNVVPPIPFDMACAKTCGKCWLTLKF